MITDAGEGFYSFGGNLYKSDIVRAAIRPKARAIGKIVGKHIRETVKADGTKDLKVNPDVYMKFLLEEPNPLMTGQMLQEKMAVQLELNNNAFAYIERDSNGYPVAIYPITATSCSALKNDQGELFLRFIRSNNGRTVTFRYTDIIHLRKDFNSNEIFGDSPVPALTPLMEIVSVADQGIIKAIKNSNVIKWLLKFNTTLRPEDIKKQTKEFIDSFLNIEAESGGAAATDAKFDAQQVTPQDYVPNASQTDRTVKRIYSFYNTNDKIVQGGYTQDEAIAYYESNVEPDVKQLSDEYTRKLFTRRERGFGNKIIFQASSLIFANLQTKLGLVSMVDRGAMTPNEWREELGLAPLEGGDNPIRRLDTAVVA